MELGFTTPTKRGFALDHFGSPCSKRPDLRSEASETGSVISMVSSTEAELHRLAAKMPDLQGEPKPSHGVSEPLDRPVTLVLTGNQSQTFGSFVRSFWNKLPPPASLDWAEEVPNGFRIRTRFPVTVGTCAEELGWTTEQLRRPPACVNVTVRGIPSSATEEELLADLSAHLGEGRAKAVRRLHASTEGEVDRTRPIPVVIVRVTEDAMDDLKTWRVFGGLRPSVAAKPRKPSIITQCRRCYAWGHRSAACKARRRCAACGENNHLRADCPLRLDFHNRRCFACGGNHWVSYAGCPERRKEEQRVRDAVTPCSQSARPTRVVSALDSFSKVVAGSSSSPRHPPSPSQPHYPHSPTTNRFSLLPLEEEWPQPQSANRVVQGERPREPIRQALNRELAHKIAQSRKRRDELCEDLERTEEANRVKPNERLKARMRSLRAGLRKTRARLHDLNDQRRRQSAREEVSNAQETNESEKEPQVERLVRQGLRVLLPVLENLGVPPAFLRALEALVLHLVGAPQCL